MSLKFKIILLSTVLVFHMLIFVPLAFSEENTNHSFGWPLGNLTKSEREARFDFFIKIKELQYYDDVSTESDSICSGLLQKIKKDEYKILSPKHFFKKKQMKRKIYFLNV